MFALVRRGAGTCTGLRPTSATPASSTLRACGHGGGTGRTCRGLLAGPLPRQRAPQGREPATELVAPAGDVPTLRGTPPAHAAGHHALAPVNCCRTACRETPRTRARSA